MTKLLRNYRSHPCLLQLYSDAFYPNELEPYADEAMTSLLCHWEGLPRRGFPLVFHGVVGEDMQEGNSPSWFNPVEIIHVSVFSLPPSLPPSLPLSITAAVFTLSLGGVLCSRHYQ